MATRKNWLEKGVRLLSIWLMPHSNGDRAAGFFCWEFSLEIILMMVTSRVEMITEVMITFIIIFFYFLIGS